MDDRIDEEGVLSDDRNEPGGGRDESTMGTEGEGYMGSKRRSELIAMKLPVRPTPARSRELEGAVRDVREDQGAKRRLSR